MCVSPQALQFHYSLQSFATNSQSFPPNLQTSRHNLQRDLRFGRDFGGDDLRRGHRGFHGSDLDAARVAVTQQIIILTHTALTGRDVVPHASLYEKEHG